MALAYDLGEVDIYDDGRLGDDAGLRDLREHLHREVTRRWVRAARNVKRAIVLHDALGIGEKAPMSVMPAADRAAMFGRWLDERLLADIGDGQWVFPYIAEAASRAQMVQQQVWNGFGDAQALGSLFDAGPDDEPRDPHGRWTAHVVLEHDSDGRIGVLGVHSDLQEAQRQASEREADNADEDSDTGNPGAAVGVHSIDAPPGDQLTILASANADGDVTVHGAYPSKAEAASARDAILRERWQREGRALDWDHPSTYATWDREVASWNAEHPDKAIGETYKFGTHPEFEQRLEKHLEGKVEPYPGARKANAYFADDFTHVQSRTVTVAGHAVGDAQALGSLVSQTTYIEPKSVKACRAATCGALAGIRDAVSRRAAEAVRTGLLFPPHSGKTSRIAKAVDAAMGEGLHRGRILAEHAVTQAYSQATLDALEARGVTHVGTHGERCLRDAGPLDGWMADEARHTPQEQHPRSGRYVTKAVHARETHRHIRTGRFTSQKVRAGKQAQAEAEEAQAESRRGPVVVETAGDDRVCDICDGIAANSPYTINRARSLIPAHPNCRCEWVRAEAPARPSLPGPIPEEAERIPELPHPAPVTVPGIAAVAAGVLASLAAAAVARPGRPPAPPAPPDPDEVLSEEPPTPPPLPAKPAPPLPEPPQLPAEEPAAEPPEPEPPLPPIEFALPAELMPQPLEPGAAPLEPDVVELINRIATRRGVLAESLTRFYPAAAPPEISAARRELMWTLNRRGWSIAAIAGWMHATEQAVAAGIARHRQHEAADYDPDQPRS